MDKKRIVIPSQCINFMLYVFNETYVNTWRNNCLKGFQCLKCWIKLLRWISMSISETSLGSTRGLLNVITVKLWLSSMCVHACTQSPSLPSWVKTMYDLDLYKILEGAMMICIGFYELVDLRLSVVQMRNSWHRLLQSTQQFCIVLLTQIQLL